MKLPFLKSKTQAGNPDEPLLALDVGTTVVKAVLFEVKSGEAIILGYGKVPQKSNSMKGAMIVDIEAVVESCDMAIGHAVKDYSENLPSRVIIGIAGELVRGVTIMANYDREDHDTKIESYELDEVIEKVRDSAFTDAVDEVAEETGLLVDQIEEISSTINDTYIDGFRVQNPLGFQGKEVMFRVFSTFAPSIHLNSLKTIAEELKLEILDIIVEPYAITRAFRGARKDEFSAIFIDIGGGTTDVAVVHNGGIVGTKMFAFGGNLFTKRVEYIFDCTFEEAEEMKLEYSNGVLSEKKTAKIKEAFYEDAKVWVNGVELALKDFEDIDVYPSHIFLCGGGSQLPDIKESLVEHPWLQVLRIQKFPDISFITPDQLENIIDDKKYLQDKADVTPAGLAYMALENEFMS